MDDLGWMKEKPEVKIPEVVEEVSIDLPAPQSIANNIMSLVKAEADRILQKAEDFEITDEASAEECAVLGTQAKKIIKAVEKERKRRIEVPNKFCRELNAMVKQAMAPVVSAMSFLETKYGNWQSEQFRLAEEARKEAERKQKELEAEQQRANEEAQKTAQNTGLPVPPPKKMAPPAPAVQKDIKKVGEGSAQVKMKWVGELVDITKVPPEFLLLNQVAVNEAVRDGMRNPQIPGVDIKQVPATTFRAS